MNNIINNKTIIQNLTQSYISLKKIENIIDLKKIENEFNEIIEKIYENSINEIKFKENILPIIDSGSIYLLKNEKVLKDIENYKNYFYEKILFTKRYDFLYLENILKNNDNLTKLNKILLDCYKNDKNPVSKELFIYVNFKYDNKEIIDFLFKNHEQDLKDFTKKDKGGNNLSYFTYNKEVLTKLEEINIVPKSKEDWVQKQIYTFLDHSSLTNNYTYKMIYNQKGIPDKYSFEAFILFLKECQKDNINLEYYNFKKSQSIMLISPPLWKFIQRDISNYEKLKDFLSPDSKDSAGNNFLQYFLNTSRKTAPNLDNNNKELLEKIFFDNKFDLTSRNLKGQDSFDLLKEIINKKTRGENQHLKNFQTFCEKILIDLSLNNNVNYYNKEKIRNNNKI